MLRIDLKVGESVKIGDIAVITLEDKVGKLSRLAIQADRSVPVKRVARQNVAQIAAERGITDRP